eukprot:6211754-Pleurochrysis_carterae.AAC.1
MCWAQSPVKTRVEAVCSSALIASHRSLPTPSRAAASTTAARRRFVARAALHVSLMMSDPASRSSERSLGRGPDHTVPEPSASLISFSLSIQRHRYFRPRAKSFFSTASTTCSAVPLVMMKAPRRTMSTTLPSAASPWTFVLSVPTWNLVVSSKPKQMMRLSSATRRAASISPTIAISLRIFSTVSYVGSVQRCQGAKQRTTALIFAPTARGGVRRESWPNASTRTANACDKPPCCVVRVACRTGIAACRASASLAGRSASARSARSAWQASSLPSSTFTRASALRARPSRFWLHSCSRVSRLRKPLARARAWSRCASAFFRSAATSAFALTSASFRVCLTLARAAASILLRSSALSFFVASNARFARAVTLCTRELVRDFALRAQSAKRLACCRSVAHSASSRAFCSLCCCTSSSAVSRRPEPVLYASEYSTNSSPPQPRRSCATRTTSHARRAGPARFAPARFGPQRRFVFNCSTCAFSELVGSVQDSCPARSPSCMTRTIACRTSASRDML